tara:strand:- start:306 stop:518 length:213 start_codon:yes stop_codon:yes gene_type:complete
MNKRKKQTENFALRAIAVVMLWFILLWVLVSLAGCHNNCAHEDIYIPRDTIMYKNVVDSVMDSVEMDCGE